MFIQGADCQYGMIDDMAEKTPIRWEEEIKMTRIAIDKINQMKPKPKFFAVCGDLVHAFPGIVLCMHLNSQDLLYIIETCLHYVDSDVDSSINSVCKIQ